MLDVIQDWRMKLLTWFKLICAGWHRNRDVWDRLDFPSGLSVFPAAKQVLAEYGGLKFGNDNEMVHLDPSYGNDIQQSILAFQRILENRLYPIGLLRHQDEEYLIIDENGIVYTLVECPTYEGDELVEMEAHLDPFSATFPDALEYFVCLNLLTRMRLSRGLREKNLFGTKCRIPVFVKPEW